MPTPINKEVNKVASPSSESWSEEARTWVEVYCLEPDWEMATKSLEVFIKDIEARAIATTTMHFKNTIIPSEVERGR